MFKARKSFAAILTIGVFAFAVSGCSYVPKIPKPANNQLATEPDAVSLRLASAVDRASVALEKLAATEQKRSAENTVESIPNAPVQLMRTVTLDWSGPAEPVLAKLADRAGYKFQVQGNEPAVPVIVNVTAVEKPVIEVLRDIGLQAGRQADVVVDAERQVVEISYAPAHSG
ncbi:MAG: DotD/TraH family lipoprotein [Pseudomonadota bacterium]